MTRLMSVAYTADAVREHRKHVTRRLGWWENRAGRRLLHPGDELDLCEKVMGRKADQPLVRICRVEVTDVRRERLNWLLTGPAGYGASEMILEGFPGLDPGEFIDRYFLTAQGIGPMVDVTRIAWRYLEDYQ